MERAAQLLLALVVSVLVLHYMQGGRDAAGRWLNYWLTGRGHDGSGLQPVAAPSTAAVPAPTPAVERTPPAGHRGGAPSMTRPQPRPPRPERNPQPETMWT